MSAGRTTHAEGRSAPTAPRPAERCLLVVLIVIIIVAGGRLFTPGLVSAQATGTDAGLGVEGVIADYTVQPGDVIVHRMNVKLGKDATTPLDVLVEARGLGQGMEGGTIALEADQDTGLFSARSFITAIDHSSFHLEPGTAQAVTATIAVPDDLKSGTRYADIYVHTLPAGSGRIGVVLATHVPVILTVAGSAFAQTGTISKLEVPPVQSGEAIQVATVVQNTGNRHYRASALVAITDSAGKQVAQRVIPQAGSSILPGFPRSYTASFALMDRIDGLPAGTYAVESTIVLEDGRVLDAKKTSFQITAPYQPFPDIDPSTLVVVKYNNEEPGPIDARQRADLQLVFRDTGKVTGTVVLGRFKTEPAGSPRISDPSSDGGLGKSGLKYWGIGVEGFNKGTAQLTTFFRDQELSGVQSNTLFLAERAAGASGWIKLDKLEVFPNAQNARGELAVEVLSASSPIGLAGDPSASFGLLDLLAGNWVVVTALVIVGLVGTSATVLGIRRRRQA